MIRETIVTTAQRLMLGMFVADVVQLESKASETNMSTEEYAHNIEIAESRCINGIAKTLEKDTCENVAPFDNEFKCSECGCKSYSPIIVDGREETPFYCPRCGRPVSR